MILMKAKIDSILDQISKSAIKAGQDPSAITLVAVSKKQPAQKMMAYIEYCRDRGALPVFGESYLQEYLEKKKNLEGVSYKVHMIGRLQSNKVKQSVELFDVIESVSSQKLAEQVNEAAREIGKTQQVYIQVNISGDPSKAGFLADECLSFFDRHLKSYSNLDVRGLMTITRMYDTPELVRADFSELRDLREMIYAQKIFSSGQNALELSMGMSADFDIAIEEGATVIRLGTALFGERN
jgi:pyridoxal phosphate enzyme (YggS family)